MIALLAPGQGSQTPGMLSPWLELPGAADQMASWSTASGLDLARL
ncbi:MAG: ACP S-malonyltransferase, partial [Mycobacterium sp.]